MESNYILEEIFKKIKNKRKLKIIKYDKEIKTRLNINNDDFEFTQN